MATSFPLPFLVFVFVNYSNVTANFLNFYFIVLADDWMTFPVKRPSSRPGFSKNWIGNHDFLMDEFSSKTVSEVSKKFANKG